MKPATERRVIDGLELRCHACDRLLGHGVETAVRVRLEHDEPVELLHPWDGTMTVTDDDVTVDAGLRVDLEAGLVNAKRRHPSGLPWYMKRHGSVLKPNVRVRLPAVVTCACGEDNEIKRHGTGWTDLPEEERADRLREETVSDPQPTAAERAAWLAEIIRARREEIKRE